ncbi:MAG: DedA family protein [Candidatus Hydrogenedentota bacterium]|nr:MAG: DedA family protein [Candidatus Hydrogenedentota bacterium]
MKENNGSSPGVREAEKERACESGEGRQSSQRSLLRRLYDWTLHWAVTPYGLTALFLLAVAEASFFPIPPDVLLIAIVAASPRLWLKTGALCTAGSVLGGMLGYTIGRFLWAGVSHFFFRYVPGFTPESFAKFQHWYEVWGVTVVFVAGFSPIPYKVFTIASGVAGMNFPAFLGASIVSRGGRFFLVAGLLRIFGERIRALIERYFDLLSLLFVILLVGGFLVISLVH